MSNTRPRSRCRYFFCNCTSVVDVICARFAGPTLASYRGLLPGAYRWGKAARNAPAKAEEICTSQNTQLPSHGAIAYASPIVDNNCHDDQCAVRRWTFPVVKYDLVRKHSPRWGETIPIENTTFQRTSYLVSSHFSLVGENQIEIVYS